ncbi:uncharacterized protein BXZ73DRAFT_103315 [Epithele typhae]|uniref:uncharacterized protein n=1 Tax=Epithele typhae TaxID=378194 RepID=UPI00200760D4|nr:uncharacterized protein BXZ73DRAFT_103315 [Epithele typhae]KAH9925441.1 hypothetical protein BXZ73DRAFT_103315 [Epithele typhae]
MKDSLGMIQTMRDDASLYKCYRDLKEEAESLARSPGNFKALWKVLISSMIVWELSGRTVCHSGTIPPPTQIQSGKSGGYRGTIFPDILLRTNHRHPGSTRALERRDFCYPLLGELKRSIPQSLLDDPSMLSKGKPGYNALRRLLKSAANQVIHQAILAALGDYIAPSTLQLVIAAGSFWSHAVVDGVAFRTAVRADNSLTERTTAIELALINSRQADGYEEGLAVDDLHRAGDWISSLLGMDMELRPTGDLPEYLNDLVTWERVTVLDSEASDKALDAVASSVRRTMREMVDSHCNP